MHSALKNPLRWGAVGVGPVSERVAREFQNAPGARLDAVAARRIDKAKQFAGRHRIPKAYASAQDLCADPDIDVVYIASPTRLHHEHCLDALHAGKHVLCEKPFTMNAEEARDVVACARRLGLFCMEGMWMRFNPNVQRLRDIVENGKFGVPDYFRAEIGWAKQDFEEFVAEERGAMLSFGCYALSLAWFLLGPPRSYVADVVRNRHGVDVSCGMLLDYPGTLVMLSASVAATQSNEALALLRRGVVAIRDPFIDARCLDLVASNKGQEGTLERWRRRIGKMSYAVSRRFPKAPAIGLTPAGAGFRGEIIETVRCVINGECESPLMPLDDTLEIHRTLDRIITGSI